MSDMASDNLLFDTIAIIGVGLIGGSLGMAAKTRGLAKRIIGIGRSEQKLMHAQILGAVDEYSLDMNDGVADADLIIICTPVGQIIPTLESIVPNLKPGAIITDVGSTKREIVEDATILMPDECFYVGGHPMAGTENTGVENAFPDMFLGATYVITPTEYTNLIALGKVTAFVDAIGARVETMTPEQHDVSVAIISHLPHAISSSLLQVAEDAQRNSGKVFSLVAGSFRDLTRISDSMPELWRDIFLSNTDPVCEAITNMQDHLQKFKEALESHDESKILRFFEQGKLIRQTYLRLVK